MFLMLTNERCKLCVQHEALIETKHLTGCSLLVDVKNIAQVVADLVRQERQASSALLGQLALLARLALQASRELLEIMVRLEELEIPV